MSDDELLRRCKDYLQILCVDIPERYVGSNGNRQATYQNYLSPDLKRIQIGILKNKIYI